MTSLPSGKTALAKIPPPHWGIRLAAWCLIYLSGAVPFLLREDYSHDPLLLLTFPLGLGAFFEDHTRLSGLGAYLFLFGYAGGPYALHLFLTLRTRKRWVFDLLLLILVVYMLAIQRLATMG